LINSSTFFFFFRCPNSLSHLPWQSLKRRRSESVGKTIGYELVACIFVRPYAASYIRPADRLMLLDVTLGSFGPND
jgi:hypothetical protein